MSKIRSLSAAAFVSAAWFMLVAGIAAAQSLAAKQEQSGTAERPTPAIPHNFDQWEKEIAAYEAADKTSPPPKGAILFIGSSTIRLWKTLAQDFPDHHVINRGFGGSEIADSTHFADRVIFPYEPKMVLIRAGGNDIHNGKSPEAVFVDFRKFVATIHARLPEAQIVYISQGPSIARITEVDKQKALNNMVLELIANLMVLSDFVSEYLVAAVQGVIIIIAMLIQRFSK